jgi:C4-type Zn-finger protein
MMVAPVRMELLPEVRKQMIACALAVADTLDSSDAVIDEAEGIVRGRYSRFDTGLLSRLSGDLDRVGELCGLDEAVVKLKEKVSFISELVEGKKWLSVIIVASDLKRNILGELKKEAY